MDELPDRALGEAHRGGQLGASQTAERGADEGIPLALGQA
jgi:hypothetical protein